MSKKEVNKPEKAFFILKIFNKKRTYIKKFSCEAF